jgi:hypothetical protein
MAKKKAKKKQIGKLCNSFVDFKQEFSFDTDAIIWVDALQYYIMKCIEETAVEMSENKYCIPVSTFIEAAKKIGLGDWVNKMPKDVKPSKYNDIDE